MSSQTRGVYAIGAALALAGLTLSDGKPATMFLLLTMAIGLTAAAALGPPGFSLASPEVFLAMAVRVFLGVGIFVFSVFFLVAGSSNSAGMVGRLAMVLVVVGSAIGMSREGRRRTSTTVFFLSYAIAIGWLLHSQGFFLGYTDVAEFHEMALASLREGLNPYSMTFPDLYDGAKSALFYGPGVSVDGVLQFGFPYLPLGLLLAAPFEWLLSDFRLALLLFTVATGVMVTLLGSGWRPRALAAGFLMIAPIPSVIAVGWTEPLMVLALVAVLLSSKRRSASTPYLLGVLLATKQTAVLLFAPSFLLYERPWSLRVVGRDLAKTIATLALLTLPFVLWDPSGFYRAVVELQIIQPFRNDSIAYPALIANQFGGYSSLLLVALPAIGIGLVAVLTLRRTPTGPQGFALASALTLLVTFAFSKQAFANYYLLPLALLVGAAALGDPDTSRRSERAEAVDDADVGSHDLLTDCSKVGVTDRKVG
jgi:hypothetical protein